MWIVAQASQSAGPASRIVIMTRTGSRAVQAVARLLRSPIEGNCGFAGGDQHRDADAALKEGYVSVNGVRALDQFEPPTT